MRKIRRIAGNTIIVCLIGIMIFSVWDIYADNYTYKKVQKKYAELPTKDFDELTEINADTIGWISSDNGIDYPVVQGEDNDKYLGTLFDGKKGEAGSIFVDCICEEPFKQFNTIIYGHHMFDGTMFTDLKEYKSEDYAKEHPFELYTKDGLYDLTVCAFMNPPSDDMVYATNLKDSEKGEYIEHIEEEAEYADEISEDDTLMVLSTCAYEYENARYVVVCKAKARERELVEVEVQPTESERRKAALKHVKRIAGKALKRIYIAIFR